MARYFIQTGPGTYVTARHANGVGIDVGPTPKPWSEEEAMDIMWREPSERLRLADLGEQAVPWKQYEWPMGAGVTGPTGAGPAGPTGETGVTPTDASSIGTIPAVTHEVPAHGNIDFVMAGKVILRIRHDGAIVVYDQVTTAPEDVVTGMRDLIHLWSTSHYAKVLAAVKRWYADNGDLDASQALWKAMAAFEEKKP